MFAVAGCAHDEGMYQEMQRVTHSGIPQIGALVHPNLWRDPQVIAACKAHDMGSLIRLWRSHPTRKHAISQRDLAVAVGVPQPRISRLESGVSGPLNDLIELREWACRIGMPPELSWFGHPHNAPVPAVQTEAEVPWAAHVDDDDPKLPPAPWQRVWPLPARRIGHEHVEAVREDVRRLRSYDHRFGSRARGFVLAQAVYDEGRVWLDAAPFGSEVCRGLQEAVSMAASNTMWAALDAGNHELSERYADEAIRLAHMAESGEAEAYALLNKIEAARFLGEWTAGAELMPWAQEVALRLGSQRLLGVLGLQESNFLARLGRKREARSRMTWSEMRLGRAGAADTFEWMEYVRPESLQASAFEAMGETELAHHHFLKLITDDGLYSREFTRNALQNHIFLAGAEAQCGDAEAASSHFRSALAEIGDRAVSSWVLDQRLAAAWSWLRRLDSVHVRDLRRRNACIQSSDHAPPFG